jgi:hypothetical protein
MTEYDFQFVQGDTFTETWAYGASTSGLSARLKVRDKYNMNAEPVISIASGDGITLSGNNIIIAFTAEDTALIPAGVYVYDLKIISGATVTTFRRGYVKVLPQSSNED